jgi:hypothetical protein
VVESTIGVGLGLTVEVGVGLAGLAKTVGAAMSNHPKRITIFFIIFPSWNGVFD